MEPPPLRVYESHVEATRPASRKVHAIIYVGIGFFCLCLVAAIIACVISGRKAKTEDAEALNAIGGVRFKFDKAERRADKRDRKAAARQEKEREKEREKLLEEELGKAGRMVQPPATAHARDHFKDKAGRDSKGQSKLLNRTPRQSSLPTSTASIKRKKSTSKEKDKHRAELERRERDKRDRKDSRKRSAPIKAKRK